MNGSHPPIPALALAALLACPPLAAKTGDVAAPAPLAALGVVEPVSAEVGVKPPQAAAAQTPLSAEAALELLDVEAVADLAPMPPPPRAEGEPPLAVAAAEEGAFPGTAIEGKALDEYAPVIEAQALVELEASWRDPYIGDERSDLLLATAALGIQVPFNDWVQGQLTFLYEDSPAAEETQDLDEFYLAVRNREATPFHLRAGRAYAPFGIYQTFMISDPLTLELGETRPLGVQLGFEEGGLYGAAYLFDGETHLRGESGLKEFGLNLGYLWLGLDTQVDLGFDYLHSLSESRNLQEALARPDGMERRAGAGAVHGSVEHGPITILAEYVAATDRFHPTDLSFNGNGAQPAAWSLEAGYSFQLVGLETTLAVGHQNSREALALGLPQSRELAALSAAVLENSALTLEYALEHDYDSGDRAGEAAGSGNAARSVTLQLATQF